MRRLIVGVAAVAVAAGTCMAAFPAAQAATATVVFTCDGSRLSATVSPGDLITVAISAACDPYAGMGVLDAVLQDAPGPGYDMVVRSTAPTGTTRDVMWVIPQAGQTLPAQAKQVLDLTVTAGPVQAAPSTPASPAGPSTQPAPSGLLGPTPPPSGSVSPKWGPRLLDWGAPSVVSNASTKAGWSSLAMSDDGRNAIAGWIVAPPGGKPPYPQASIRSGTRWSAPVVLARPKNAYGLAVAMSRDGSTAVTAWNQGRSTGIAVAKRGRWGATTNLANVGFYSLTKLAIAPDGSQILAVDGKGTSFYAWSDSTWSQVASPVPLGDAVGGIEVAWSSDSGRAIVVWESKPSSSPGQTPNLIHAAVWDRDAWTALPDPPASEAEAGLRIEDVAVSGDASAFIVGGSVSFPEGDMTYAQTVVRTYASGTWSAPTPLSSVESSHFSDGDKVQTSMTRDGRSAMVTWTGSGSRRPQAQKVRVARLVNGQWIRTVALSDPRFTTGYLSHALSPDGQSAALVWKQYRDSVCMCRVVQTALMTKGIWSKPVTVSDPRNTPGGERIAMSATGRIVTVTWTRGPGGGDPSGPLVVRTAR